MPLNFISKDVGVVKQPTKDYDVSTNIIYGKSDYHKEWYRRKCWPGSWQRKHLNKRWMDWYYRNHARRKAQMLKKYHLNKALSTQKE